MAVKQQVSMTVTGIKEVDAKFNKLQHKIKISIGKKALRQAAKVELEYAKNMVPVNTGKLRKSLSVNSMKVSRNARRAGIFGFKVAPRKSRKAEVQYITIVEKGEYKGSSRRTPLQGTFFLKRSSIVAKPRVNAIFKSALKRLIAEQAEMG